MTAQSRWQRFTAFLCIGIALLHGGCTAPTNLTPDEPIVLDETRAVLLASVTMEYEGDFFARTSFHFSRQEGAGRFRLDSAVPWTIWPMLEKKPDPGLEAVHGRLYAFTVPAGAYALANVTIHDSPAITVRPKERYTFVARGGEITYIGNLDVRLCHLLSPRDRFPYYIAGGRPSVSDRSERDLPLLRSMFPQLDGAPIMIRTLDNEAIGRLYGGLARKCPM